MRAGRVALFVGVASLAGLLPDARPARADDWSITREPPSRREGRPARSRSTSAGSSAARGARPLLPAPASAARDLDRETALALARPDDEAVVLRLVREASAARGGLPAWLEALRARRGEGARIDALLGAIALVQGDEASAQAAIESAIARDERLDCAYALGARLALARAPEEGVAARERAAELLSRAIERTHDAATRERRQRELLAIWVELPDGLARARALHAELARGGSSLARMELARLLAGRGRCEDALAEIERLRAARDMDASATVSLALLAAECDARFERPAAALDALRRALPAATRSGRIAELLDALITSGRAADGLGALVAELGALGAPARLHLGIVLEELGRDDEALAAFRDVLRRDPRDAETRQRVARLLARTGRLDEALSEQRALARLFPDHVALALELARALVDRGLRAEGLAVLDRIRARVGRDRSTLYLLADAYARLGEGPRTVATLEAIVRARPGDPRGVIALASELMRSHDPAARRRALELVEGLAGPDDGFRGHLEAARALATARILDRALEHLEAAAHLAPDAPEVLDAEAEIFEIAGRHDDVERALERRVALASSGADDATIEAGIDAESRLVSFWARRGTLARHRADLETASRGGSSSAARMLADLERRSGRLDAARDLLLELLGRHPEDARLVGRLARLEHERGDYDAEVRAILELARLEPARAGLHYSELVELALAAYRDDDALRFAEEAARRSAGDADVLVRLGRLHARRRDVERAARAYARALELDPDAHEAAWELATLERSRGDARRAMELQLSIFERARDDELRDRAGRAVLETARAAGAEGSIEPTLLALALARGDAPIYRRIALSLYGALTSDARARGDDAALDRWVTRALPVLFAALRDSDVGARLSARQILFAHPVAGASSTLIALAADRTIEPAARIAALYAALAVLQLRDAAALLSLFDDPSEPLRVGALHGLARLASRATGRSTLEERAFARARASQGPVAEHAWALGLLAPPRASSEPAGAPPSAWLAAYRAARLSSASRPTRIDAALALIEDAALGREERAALGELAASGTLEPSSLEALAARALAAPAADRALLSRIVSTRVEPSLECAPPLAVGESSSAWMARVVAACPRAPRDPQAVSGALVAAVSALAPPEIPAAIEAIATWPDRAALGAGLEVVTRAIVARAGGVGAMDASARRALIAILVDVPAVLSVEAWRALLEDDDRAVRLAAVRAAPLPALGEALVDRARSDPAWEVRRASFARLSRGSALAPGLASALVARGLEDEIALVRIEALSLASSSLPDELCSIASEASRDRDSGVAARATALAEGACAR